MSSLSTWLSVCSLALIFSHICYCGSQVDTGGLHGLTCKLAFGRTTRQQPLIKVFSRAFVFAGIPATRQPTGSGRGDGKHLGCMMLVPWQFGKPLMRDVTVAHTMADLYVSCTSHSSGAAAELVASRKSAKWRPALVLSISVHEVETLASVSITPFFTNLGSEFFVVFSDARETSFLFHQISVTTQHFSLVVFCSSFLPIDDSDD